jgi:hypothetical protein
VERFCNTPGADGAGGAADDVEVVGTVGGGGVAVVVPAGAHVSDSPSTGSFTGNDKDDSGVPGGTFIVNDSFAPPITVTVTTHESADAVAGTNERPVNRAAMPTSRRARLNSGETS